MPWNIRDAVRKDKRLIAAFEDCSPAMEEAADILFQAIEENFQDEAAAGDGWKALAESTIAERRQKGYGDGPILIREGGLRSAATSHKEVDSHSSEVGVSPGHPYAKYHAGLPRRGDYMPFRNFLAISEEHKKRITAAITRHFDR